MANWKQRWLILIFTAGPGSGHPDRLQPAASLPANADPGSHPGLRHAGSDGDHPTHRRRPARQPALPARRHPRPRRCSPTQPRAHRSPPAAHCPPRLFPATRPRQDCPSMSPSPMTPYWHLAKHSPRYGACRMPALAPGRFTTAPPFSTATAWTRLPSCHSARLCHQDPRLKLPWRWLPPSPPAPTRVIGSSATPKASCSALDPTAMHLSGCASSSPRHLPGTPTATPTLTLVPVASPSPTPSPTATPPVQASDTVILSPLDLIDLDTLELQPQGADLVYQTGVDNYHFFTPM